MEFVNFPTDIKLYITEFIDLQDLFNWMITLSCNRKCKEVFNNKNKKKILDKFNVDTTKSIKIKTVTHVTIVDYKFNIIELEICPICHEGSRLCEMICEDCNFYSCNLLDVVKREPKRLCIKGKPSGHSKRCKKCSKFQFNDQTKRWEPRTLTQEYLSP